MILYVLLETLAEPVFWIIAVWLAYKCLRVYGRNFIPPFKD